MSLMVVICDAKSYLIKLSEKRSRIGLGAKSKIANRNKKQVLFTGIIAVDSLKLPVQVEETLANSVSCWLIS